MIYILFNKGLLVHVTSESPYTGMPELKKFPGIVYDEAKNSNDFESLTEVETLAMQLTAMTGDTWLPFDNGEWTSARYGVFQPPKVGDDVSYGFNGDYYPCGKIVRITKGWRIYTEDAPSCTNLYPVKPRMFNRKKQTSQWTMSGGTWSLVRGIVDERNQSF